MQPTALREQLVTGQPDPEFRKNIDHDPTVSVVVVDENEKTFGFGKGVGDA